MLSKADIEVSLIYYICSTVPETKKIKLKTENWYISEEMVTVENHGVTPGEKNL